MATQPGFFDVEERLQRLSDIGDQLEAYAAVVDRTLPPRAGGGAGLFGRREGRSPAVRPGPDVQDPGDPGAERPQRRQGGIPDQRPVVVHAVPRPRAERPGTGRQPARRALVASGPARPHEHRRRRLGRYRLGRARVRGTETGHGTDRSNHRSRPGANEDRDGQPRVQHPPSGATPRPSHRLTVRPRGAVCTDLLNEPHSPLSKTRFRS